MPGLSAWAQLLAAGALEVVMAFALKASAGATRPGPSLLAVLAALASIRLLAAAVRTLPLGVAYAVWTGIGALGVSLVGVVVCVGGPGGGSLIGRTEGFAAAFFYAFGATISRGRSTRRCSAAATW